MGYRSDVRIVTTKKGYEELKKFSDDYLSKQKEDCYNLLEHCDIKMKNDYSYYFGWNWVKWYEGSYPDVDAIVEGLQHLEDNGLSYRFARMGESYDDYEEYSYESEIEEEQDLEYPSTLREFDDDYIIQNMDLYPLNKNKEEAPIEV